MKQFFLFLFIAVSVTAMAQDVEWVDVSVLNYVASGGTDMTHASRQFLMFDESSVDADDPVIRDLRTFSEEYGAQMMQNASDESIKMLDQGIESLRQAARMMPENKDEFESQIKEMEKMREEARGMASSEPVQFSVDPANLLKQLTAMAINKKPYSYYKDIGGGLFAVTEAPVYGDLSDSGYNRLDMPDEYTYTWGAIDSKGKTVIPAEYDTFDSFDPDHDYIILYCKDAKGQVRCGIRGYDGRIRLPFVYEEDYGSSGPTGIAVFRKDGKLGMVDFDGKVYQPFEYTFASMFSHGWIVSKDDKNYGVVSREGKLVIPMKYKDYWGSESDIFQMERFDGRLDVYDSAYKLIRTEEKQYE